MAGSAGLLRHLRAVLCALGIAGLLVLGSSAAVLAAGGLLEVVPAGPGGGGREVQPLDPVDATEPVVKVIAPALEPLAEEGAGVAEAAAPGARSVAQVAAPVVEAATEPLETAVDPIEPGIQPSVEPVIELVEPLVDGVEPVIEPIVEIVDPIVDPVLLVVEPVVDPVVPIVEPWGRVIDPAIPGDGPTSLVGGTAEDAVGTMNAASPGTAGGIGEAAIRALVLKRSQAADGTVLAITPPAGTLPAAPVSAPGPEPPGLPSGSMIPLVSFAGGFAIAILALAALGLRFGGPTTLGSLVIPLRGRSPVPVVPPA